MIVGQPGNSSAETTVPTVGAVLLAGAITVLIHGLVTIGEDDIRVDPTLLKDRKHSQTVRIEEGRKAASCRERAGVKVRNSKE